MAYNINIHLEWNQIKVVKISDEMFLKVFIQPIPWKKGFIATFLQSDWLALGN